ncbi:MAG: hemolysin family protein [Actinomycetota bacterium]
MSTSTALLVGLALLLANGFFVAAEFALLAARRSKIEQLAEEGSGSATQALAGLRELSLMLAGAQLGITMASLGLGATAEPALHHTLDAVLAETAVPRPVSATLSLVLALGVTVFLHMVVGEMAPKSWAIGTPERAVRLLARPFRLFVTALRPFIRLLNGASNLVVRGLGVEPQDELAQVHAPGDLALLLEESARRGQIDTDEQTLLTRALELSGLDAEAAMVPRREVVAVSVDADIDTLERVASESGRSRLPVYEGELDRVVGVLHVKDLLGVRDEARPTVRAGALASPALLVPESRPVEALMRDMRAERQHLAVVVDEFGGFSGLVALEDLLEELIGDFEDETDRRAEIVQRSDGAVLVPGSLRPDELSAHLGVTLPDGPWETLAGYLTAELERLPVLGDAADGEGFRVEVTRMDGHRVVELAVRLR